MRISPVTFSPRTCLRLCLALFVLAGLTACSDLGRDSASKPSSQLLSEPKPESADEFPVLLSDWGVLHVSKQELVPGSRSVAYDLNTPLFTDYAHKFRTLWVPKGKAATFDDEGMIQFPVGTIISKTFFYPREGEHLYFDRDETLDFGSKGLDLDKVRLIETRLLVHRPDGWQGLPYVWNEQQTEANLEIAGSAFELALYAGTGANGGARPAEPVHQFTYAVPDFNQCQGCHIEDLSTEKVRPIGLKPRHINKAYAHMHEAENQLAHFVQNGLLAESSQFPLAALPRNAKMDSREVSLNERARSYLDINCGHCHNRAGAGDTSGLFLNIEETDQLRLGVCKPPIAAGQGTGGRFVSIQPGKPDQSILSYRMESLDLGAMMPELGRATVHREGVELIKAWIEAMPGECNIEEVNLI